MAFDLVDVSNTECATGNRYYLFILRCLQCDWSKHFNRNFTQNTSRGNQTHATSYFFSFGKMCITCFLQCSCREIHVLYEEVPNTYKSCCIPFQAGKSDLIHAAGLGNGAASAYLHLPYLPLSHG